MISIEDALQKIIDQADSLVSSAEQTLNPTSDPSTPSVSETLNPVLDGFPSTVEGEILFLDADNINTDGIYPGKYTYQDNITAAQMAEVCMSNYDEAFPRLAQPGDILVAGFNFGCGSSREQAATAILARQIPLVVAGSFGGIFGRNSVNNALMGVEMPRLIERLREAFSNQNPPPAAQKSSSSSSSETKVLTRRTGWKLKWDVARSLVEIQEGENGKTWSQKVGELPPNVQEIIARGGLEGWVKAQIAAEA